MPQEAKTETMKAWVCRRYGGSETLDLVDVPKPVPKADEILVRILATTVSSGDMRVRSLRLPKGFGLIGRLAVGLTGPRRNILGTEFAGVVEAVGADVTAYKAGDRVIGFPGAGMGSHAQFRTMPANGAVAAMPANLSLEEAASLCFGGTTALHFLRKAGLKGGESLLVIGASGAVGSAMVQLGRHMGARVTAVTSAANMALTQELGAERVIDYARTDFVAAGERHDIIADTVGASSFAKCLGALNEGGRYLSVAGGVADLLARPVGTRRPIAGQAPERPEDVAELAQLAEQGAFRPVIDRVYDFADMRAAHDRVDTGRKRGSVVVRMGT